MDFVVCYHMVRYGSMDFVVCYGLEIQEWIQSTCFPPGGAKRHWKGGCGRHRRAPNKNIKNQVDFGRQTQEIFCSRFVTFPSICVFWSCFWWIFPLSSTVQKRNFTWKKTPPNSWNVCCFFATLTVRYPEYFRVPQDDSNASRTGALVDVKTCKKRGELCHHLGVSQEAKIYRQAFRESVKAVIQCSVFFHCLLIK